MNTSLIIGIVVGAVVVIAAMIVALVLINKKKNKKVDIPTNDDVASKIVAAVGGKENITNVSSKMTRLSIGVKSSSSFNSESLPEFKAMIMETKITLLVGSDAEAIAKEIEKLVK